MDDKSGVGSDGGWRVAGEQAPFTGGTMEWGLEEARSICLPALERCYEVRESLILCYRTWYIPFIIIVGDIMDPR